VGRNSNPAYGLIMHLQLQAIIDEFTAAEKRLNALVERTSEESWPQRPDPSRWSMSECVAHLNLTSAAYVTLLKDGIADARRLNRPAAERYRYRHDLSGWFLWKTMGPPVRFRIKTTAPFVPASTAARSELAADFERLQKKQIECVRESDGVPIDRIRISSPFEARFKYNLYSSLAMLPRHQHRHLWQAEQVWMQLRRPGR
jgi:hypothetical protein